MDGDHRTRGDGQALRPDSAPDAAVAAIVRQRSAPTSRAGRAGATTPMAAVAQADGSRPAATPLQAVPTVHGWAGPPETAVASPRSEPGGLSATVEQKDVLSRCDAANRDPAQPAVPLPSARPIVAAGDMLCPPREIAASTSAAKILFTRDDLDTTYVSGRRGMMVLSLVEDGSSYRVGRYDVESGEWRILSKGWPRFGNALAFACTIVS